MLLGEAEVYAAQLYCEPEHKAKVLDHDLVKSMGRLLMRKVNEAQRAVRLDQARTAYYEELAKDPDLYRTYVDNVSIVLQDVLKRVLAEATLDTLQGFDVDSKGLRDRVAKEVLLKLFGVKY